WAQDFTATTVEGVEMKFKVISETDKTCCVGTDLLALIDPSQEASADNLSCIAIDPYYAGKVTIPGVANGYTVTTIGEGAFQFCEYVTEFEIPTTITSIHKQAFAYCSAVTALDIPDEVQELGDACFYWCESAKSIKLPAGLTSIPQMMVTSCHALENIELPAGIESIPNSAFAYCTSLAHIDVPEGVTLIDVSGFLHCEALQSITLPTTLKRINNGAFTNCEQLEAIELPEGIEYLGDFIFWNCYTLTTFAFPASLTHIGTFLLASDANITSVYSYLPEPIDLGDFGNTQTFTMLPGITGACTLYVPAGTVDLYRAASGWNVFVNIEEMPQSSINEIRSASSADEEQHYNLLGQPIDAGTPGIHIVAGKKVLVK
ncbi:MAG: leucine-rich repeat protein, partial [Muribaculaceae bacterium]|nr:leucine-rich repeat protein [Muribaculaceae bacterium]